MAQPENGLLQVGQGFYHLHHPLYAFPQCLVLFLENRHGKFCGGLLTSGDINATVACEHPGQWLDGHPELVAHLPKPQQYVLHHVLGLVGIPQYSEG